MEISILQSHIGISANDIYDGLRLAQIKSPLEEGSLGKFSGGRQHRAALEQALEHPDGDKRAPMNAKLDYVLPGVRIRRAKKCEQTLIDAPSIAIHNVT